MQIITQPKTLFLTLIACGFSAAACAGDKTNDTAALSFAKADSNEDSLLTRDEFKLFVALEAEAGVADYAAINEDGHEDVHFSGKDIDGDGLLTKDELAYKVILNNQPAEIKPSYGSANKATDDTVETPSHSGATTPEIEPNED